MTVYKIIEKMNSCDENGKNIVSSQHDYDGRLFSTYEKAQNHMNEEFDNMNQSKEIEYEIVGVIIE